MAKIDVRAVCADHVLHLAGNAGCNVDLRGEHETGDADIGLDRHPVDALGKGPRAAETRAYLVGEVTCELQVLLRREATACRDDDVGLGQVDAALLDGLGRDELDRVCGSDPGKLLGAGVGTGCLEAGEGPGRSGEERGALSLAA